MAHPDEALREETLELQHEFFKEVIEDVRDLSNLVEDYEEIRIVLADDWKRTLYEESTSLPEERPEFGEAMEMLVEGREQYAEAIQGYLEEYLEQPDQFPSSILSREEEAKVLDAYRSFLATEFDAEINVIDESESDHQRASRAEPMQPAIVMD